MSPSVEASYAKLTMIGPRLTGTFDFDVSRGVLTAVGSGT